MTVRTIVLDAGHGGKDQGASGFGLKEKDVALKLVTECKKYLEANFKEVNIQLTRSADTYPSLSDRTKKANGLNADLFVSFHCNAATTSSATGFETYIFNGKVSSKAKTYQTIIHQGIVKNAPYFTDRGKRTANFQVLRDTKMPSILIEYGFISNEHDNAVQKDNAKLQKLAYATADAIADALGLVRKPVQTNSTWKVSKTFDDETTAKTYLASLERDGHKSFTIEKQ